MSYFPHAARLFVVLALTCAATALPSTADAADHPRSSARSRHHAHELTRQQIRERARARARAAAAAAEAARVHAARLHARAVALRNLRLRNLRLRNNKRIPHRAAIVFDKFQKNPYNSRIIFRSWAKAGPKRHKKWIPVEHVSWRAGSGLSGAAGRDACHRGMGWSPNGVYSFVQHNRRKAPLINGRVFELQSHTCHNGTLRQLMFIHSEQNSNNTQCKNRKGDDGCRWEVPKVNDYRSWGCIKMAPGDLAQLTRRFHRYFRAEVRYPTSVVKVRVKS
jgi:hypothetical protein